MFKFDVYIRNIEVIKRITFNYKTSINYFADMVS